MRRPIPFLAFLVLSFLLSVSLTAQSANGPPLGGYSPAMTQITKRQHELGFVLSFSRVSMEDFGSLINFMGGATYQYNINPYVGWYTEGHISWDPVFLKNAFTVGPYYTSPTLINQMSAAALTGVRVYPWQNWFYMGAGVGFRVFNSFMEHYRLIASQIPDLQGRVPSAGSPSPLSYTPQYYAELGLAFPIKYLIIEVGYRWRGSMLGGLQDFLDVKTDFASKTRMGEILVRMTFPLGKQARSKEEKWQDPLTTLAAEEIKVEVTSVFFTPNSYELNPAHKRRLNEILPLICKLNPRQIILRGHAYNAGDPVWEKEISQRRALATKDYLESLGVRGITIEAAGSDLPWDGSDNDMRRRVGVMLIR